MIDHKRIVKLSLAPLLNDQDAICASLKSSAAQLPLVHPETIIGSPIEAGRIARPVNFGTIVMYAVAKELSRSSADMAEVRSIWMMFPEPDRFGEPHHAYSCETTHPA